MNHKSQTPEERSSDFAFTEKGMIGIMDDLHKLQNTLDRLTAENNDLKDRINTLSVDYDYAKNQVIQANDNLRIETKKSAELENVKRQLETKTTALSNALRQLDAANKTISNLNSSVSLDTFKQSRALKSAEDEAKRLESNHEHAKSVINQLTSALALANKKLEETKHSENHLARKSIELYQENQKLNVKITDLTKQIEELKKSKIPVTPKGKIDTDKLRPAAPVQFINLLKQELEVFNNKPIYIRLVEAPGLLKNITELVNDIYDDNNPASSHTPNTSSSK